MDVAVWLSSGQGAGRMLYFQTAGLEGEEGLHPTSREIRAPAATIASGAPGAWWKEACIVDTSVRLRIIPYSLLQTFCELP